MESIIIELLHRQKLCINLQLHFYGENFFFSWHTNQVTIKKTFEVAC